jgi:hypothetical protein
LAVTRQLPLLLFLIAGLLVCRRQHHLGLDGPAQVNFWLVRLHSGRYFALSATAFWLTANTVRSSLPCSD